MEIWQDSKIIYDGTVVTLRVGSVTLDNGNLAHREVIEHPGGVCVIPYTGHSVVLVKQFRIALNDYVLEAPAGILEGEENTLFRGEAELEEETGYRAKEMIDLGATFSTVGYCTEKIHYYLARDLIKTEQRLEEEERIELVELTLDEVQTLLDDFSLIDGKTDIILRRMLSYLAQEK